MGALTSAAIITVADEAALAALTCTNTQVFVLSHKSLWFADETSTLTPKAHTVVARSAGGNWVRTEFSHPEWVKRPIWYVDFTSGNDEADGALVGTALHSLAELVRRVGYDAVFEQDTTIHTSGTHTAEDALRCNWTLISTPDSFAIGDMRRVWFRAAAATVDYTGTFSAVQAINRATNTACVVTNALDPWPVYPVVPTVGGPFTWSTSDGWRLRITSGPRAGAIAWVANSGNTMGPTTRRTTNWIIEDADPVLGFTEVAPQAGDTYAREACPALFIDDVIVHGNVGPNAWWSYLGFDGYTVFGRHGFDTQDTSPVWIPITNMAGGFTVFRNCNIGVSIWATQVAANSSCYMLNCSSYPQAFAGIGFVYIDAGVVHPAAYAAQGSRVFVDGGCMGNAGGFVALDGGTMSLMDACCFGLPAHGYPGGISAEHQGVLMLGSSFYRGVCTVWGVVTGPYGLSVIEGAQFEVDPTHATGLTLTGADGDFCVGPPQTPGSPATSIAFDDNPVVSTGWYAMENIEAPGTSIGTLDQTVASIAASTQPGILRPMDVDFPAGWVGGTVRVIGTGRDGSALSEEFTMPGGGGLVKGTVPFLTLTSFVNSAPGGVGGTVATIKLHDGYGVPHGQVVAFLKVSVDGVADTFASTDVPNGVFEPNAAHHSSHRVDVWFTYIQHNAPSYTTKRTCTWANLGAPLASGGFNYNVHDLATNAHILKEYL